MQYAVEQRLRLIDFLLAEYGSVRRQALIDYYGISMPQASTDFSAYMKLAPGNMRYDLKVKRYLRTDTFKRVWN